MSNFSSKHSGHSGFSKPHSVEKWSSLARLFHWGSVILLVLTWVMHVLDSNTEGSTYLLLHKAFGVSLLFWMIARVINRMFSKTPSPVPMPIWQKAIAHLTHFVLYILLFAMPIAGVLMSWYGGHGIDMFGLFEIPPMVETDRSQARFFNNLHTDVFWPALLIFTAIHIVGALFHQFIQKDNMIARIK